MINKDHIDNLLQEQWQYYSDKLLLVLHIGSQDTLCKLQLTTNEGYLYPDFKQAFTQHIINSGLIEGTHGPFDDDYFSGIEDENGQLNYYFEIYNMEQEQVLEFIEHYPVVFVMSEEQLKES